MKQRNPWRIYEYLKRRWRRAHPSASRHQYERAVQAIAQRLAI